MKGIHLSSGNWYYFYAVLLLLIGGCQQIPNDIKAPLRMGLAIAPVNLDPRLASDAASTRINRLLYRRLVEIDANGRAIPGLADWEVLNPTYYRFHLRDDSIARTFSNGTRLTANDVRVTFTAILDPTLGSPYRTQLAAIKRLVVLDNDYLDVELFHPDPLLPAHLSLDILPALVQATKHPFQTVPLGSGPFVLMAWPTPNQLKLQRRADAQMIEFLEVRDPSVRVMKLLRGEIDLLQSDLPPELFRLLKQRPEIAVNTRRGINFTYLGLNLQDARLAQLVVRQALAQAIDREAIIHYVLGDAARPAAALFPPEHEYGVADLVPLPYHPERARELLEQAGFNSEHPLELEYKTSTDPFRVRLATLIQAQLAAIGVRIRVHSLDWGTFYGDIKAGRFQMFSLTWVGVKTPDHFRYMFHSSAIPPHGANRGYYQSADADALIERGESTLNPVEQIAAYRYLQRLLLTDLPYIPLWYEHHISAQRTDVIGYEPAADGNWDGLSEIRRKPLP